MHAHARALQGRQSAGPSICARGMFFCFFCFCYVSWDSRRNPKLPKDSNDDSWQSGSASHGPHQASIHPSDQLIDEVLAIAPVAPP